LSIHSLMLVLDAVWWRLALRRTNRRLWRVMIGLFMGSQMAVHGAFMCGILSAHEAPRYLLIPVLTWHYFGLPLGFLLFMPSGARQVRQWFRRSKSSGSLPEENLAVAGEPSVRALTRREFFGACAAMAPPLFTIGSTGLALAEMQRLRVRRFDLPIAGLPRDLDGVTIAHVSDIHLGGLTSARVLRDMVEQTNRMKPDLVLLTGDLINYELSDLPEALALVKAMDGRYGRWMIEGNHDLFDDEGEFRRRVKAAGIPLLVDESAIVEVRGCPVQLFGLAWLGGAILQPARAASLQVREVLRHKHADAFPILLAHHPHAFDAAIEHDLPLTLSGHTHGGFWMPDGRHGIGSMFFRYWSGLYTRGRSQLIVSNGVGNWSTIPPVRVNAPAEIVQIRLGRAKQVPSSKFQVPNVGASVLARS
jgi:predicted MPP superfamily phosphohydrolase